MAHHDAVLPDRYLEVFSRVIQCKIHDRRKPMERVHGRIEYQRLEGQRKIQEHKDKDRLDALRVQLEGAILEAFRLGRYDGSKNEIWSNFRRAIEVTDQLLQQANKSPLADLVDPVDPVPTPDRVSRDITANNVRGLIPDKFDYSWTEDMIEKWTDELKVLQSKMNDLDEAAQLIVDLRDSWRKQAHTK